MPVLPHPLAIAFRRPRIVRLASRRACRLLALLLVATLGLAAGPGAVSGPDDDEADREERVAFRHFL